VSAAADSSWDRRGEVAGLPLFWREAAPAVAVAPVLYLHGVPTNSDDFLPFLELSGGIAPDLPGFGRSAKPADFDYSIRGYTRFIAAFLEQLGIERFSLVVHDWGGLGLGLPPPVMSRLDRLVVMNAVPLSAGYRWHRIARLWRTPLVGELTMGFTTRWGLKRVLGNALVAPGPAPDFLVDRVWDHFDHGTQRAILKLYRAGEPAELRRAGGRLAEIRCPALVVWGARDPYIAPSFASACAQALGGPATVELLDDAAHWPWLDRPDVAETVARFVAGGE
jgi:pimeloyl-ACP methyl ester carboxylesterase